MDYDAAIIGSGFGGSVSALRLVEKGYKVAVIEQGQWVSPADVEEDHTEKYVDAVACPFSVVT